MVHIVDSKAFATHFYGIHHLVKTRAVGILAILQTFYHESRKLFLLQP